MAAKQTGLKVRIGELEDRKKALESKISALERAGIDRDKITELEHEIEELELMLQQRRKEADMEKNIEALQTIEKAVGVAGIDFAKVRRDAEAIYDRVVAGIMKRDGCNESTAHARASNDPVGKSAYATVIEMQEREITAREGANRMAAYLG